MDQDHAPRWGEGSEDKDQLEGDTQEAPAISPFSRKWINQELFTDTSSEDSKDDDNEDNTKKRRFRSLFKRLFPSIATKESVSSDEETLEAPKRSLLAEFMLPQEEPVYESTSEVPETSSYTNTAEEAVNELDTTPIETEQLQYEAIESEPEMPEVNREQELTSTPEVPQQVPVLEQQQRQPLVMEQLVTPPLLARTERAAEPQPVAEPGREKSGTGAAIVGFLSAEFLSRRRHRKLKKEIKKLKAKTEKLEKVVAEKKEIIDGRQDTKERTEMPIKPPEQAPPTIQNIETPPPIVAPIILEKGEKVAQPTESQKGIQNVEAQAADEQIKSPEPETPKQEVEDSRMDYFLRRREEQLEKLRKTYEQQSVQAVEANNKRSEKDFDRRHEVLDEPAASLNSAVVMPVPLAPASSIGDVLKERTTQQSNKSGIASKNMPTKQPNDPPTNMNMYQQSAQYGMAIGMVIALLAVITYVVR